LTGANSDDVIQLLPLIDGIPPVSEKPGSQKNHPDEVYADRAYDLEPHREGFHKRGVKPHMARRNQEHRSGLGIFRWVSERTLAGFITSATSEYSLTATTKSITHSSSLLNPSSASESSKRGFVRLSKLQSAIRRR
jgi:hypothetical protein